MHTYYPERAAYEKIAEARAAAARYRLALEAERAGWKTRQTAGSPLTQLLRTLASTLKLSRPVCLCDDDGLVLPRR
jgi:hypothetical protein